MLFVMAKGMNISIYIMNLKILIFRFSHPSWQVTVYDRKFTTNILLPDNLDKLKEITTHISGVLKRPVYADLPEKQFKEYFKAQLVEHIRSRDINKVIISYTGKESLLNKF